MGIILQRCKRTGALAEDCGGNFACDCSCDLEDFEAYTLDEIVTALRIASPAESRLSPAAAAACASFLERSFGGDC